MGQSHSSPNPTERNVGSGVFIAGVLAIGVAYYFRHRAVVATDEAFRSYTKDLGQSLRVCAKNMTIVPCEQVAADSSAAP